MPDVSIDLIKQLRERTQASFADCKTALEETGGDLEEAVKRLRVRGSAIAEKRGEREVGAGIIEAYVHGNSQVGVLVDLRSETDFVARSEDFKNLAHDIALQIAASNPKYIDRGDIPQEAVDDEKRLVLQQYADSKKPKEIVEKIAEGKILAMAKENSLLLQPFIKDQGKTVADLINEAVAKFGEKIRVARFTRYQI